MIGGGIFSNYLIQVGDIQTACKMKFRSVEQSFRHGLSADIIKIASVRNRVALSK